MPTKNKRIAISVSANLEAMLIKEADFSKRPLSSQVVIILEKHFAEKQKELDYFRPNQLHEGERRTAPVFETKRLPDAEPVSALHEHLSRDKS